MAIQENEIRIGNWFRYKETVWSFLNPNADKELNNFQWSIRNWFTLGERTLNLDSINPIELTEEWLLKFGFVKGTFDQVSFYYSYYDPADKWPQNELLCVELWNYNLPTGEFVKWWVRDIKNKYRLKYVHELQNLFYGNFKTELPIKP